MVRRRKADVLTELPPKRRQQARLSLAQFRTVSLEHRDKSPDAPYTVASVLGVDSCLTILECCKYAWRDPVFELQM